MSKKQIFIIALLARVGGLIGGVISSRFLMGKPAIVEKTSEPLKVVEAEEFRLVDGGGGLRGLLALDKAGNSVLKLMNRKGELQFHIDSKSQRFSMGTLDKNKDSVGLDRWNINMFVSDGKPVFAMRSNEGFGASIDLGIRKGLVLSDQKGLGRVWVYLDTGEDNDARPSIALWDKNALSRAILGYAEIKMKETGGIRVRPLSSLTLLNEQGNIIWQAP